MSDKPVFAVTAIERVEIDAVAYLHFVIDRVGDNQEGATLAFMTRDDTAIADSDYLAVAGVIELEPGEVMASVAVELLPEGAGAFLFQLTAMHNCEIDCATRAIISQAPPPEPEPGPEPGEETFANLAVYAGGFVTGGTMDKTGGTLTGHCDTYGGYVRRPGDAEAIQILTQSRLGHLTSDGRYGVEFDGSGLYTLACAPSDGTIGFGVVWGKVFATQGNWEPGSFYACPLRAQVSRTRFDRGSRAVQFGEALANTGAQRLWNDKAAISHFDPLTAIVGFQGASGAWVTRDLFQSEPHRIEGIPDPEPYGGYPSPLLVAADPSSPMRWAILSQGHGVYVSESGADGAFALTDCPNTPTSGGHMLFDSAGTLYVVTLKESADNVWRYDGSEWTVEPHNVARPWHCLAINPDNVDEKILMSLEGFCTFTPSWSPGAWLGDTQYPWWPYTSTYRAPVVKWLEADGAGLFASKLQFDAADHSKVFLTHGTGMCRSDMRALVDWYGPWSWQDVSEGITQIVPQGGLWFESGKSLVTGWDKGWFQLEDMGTSPTCHYPQDVGFTAGWDSDRQGSFAVVLANWYQADSRKSADEGDTWEALAPHPDGWSMGGSIACFNSLEFVILPANNGRAIFSADGGKTWDILDLGGLLPSEPGQETGWSFAYYFRKKIACTSKLKKGLGWLWNYGPAGIPELQGLWRSRGGVWGPWEHCFKGAPQDNGAGAAAGEWSYHCQLEEVPGREGHLLFAAGLDQWVPLCASIDAGDNFGPVPTKVDGQVSQIHNCAGFGFGKAAPGARDPVIRYWGTVNQVPGLYETRDYFDNSELVTRCIDDSMDTVKFILGSPAVEGDWIYGFSGSGWKCSSRMLAQRR